MTRRRGVLGSLALLVLAGPVALRVAPTPPPRPPLAAAVAVPAGLALGVALFVLLARSRPRMLAPRTVVAAALLLAAAGASEEALWRGLALARLASVAGVWAALALTTAGFAATHVPALRRRAAVQLVTGAVFGGLFAATGSLLACVLAHGAYNVLAVLGRRQAPASAALLRGVERRYGSVRALGPLDLAIEPGELVALLGPNGAGKSTLVGLLLGLRRPGAGEVRVFGRDPRGWRARRALGATPQEMGFPPTVRVAEVLELARAHAGSPPPLADLLARFDLERVARRQTGGLSGGQRRRLAVALAFAGSPRLVVLDEPTAGLDVESRRRVWDVVREFAAGGGTVLLTTHHLEEAEALAGRVVVLDHGAVVADAPPAELAAGDGLEQAFLRLTRA